MRRWIKIPAAALLAAAVLWAVTLNGSLEVLGALRANIVDFSSSASTIPMQVGATLPAGCTVGQAFFKSDAAPGQNVQLCTAPNTWTQAGGGIFDWKPSTRYSVYRTDFPYIWNQGTPAYFGDWIMTRLTGSQNLNNPRGAGNDATHIGVIGISTTATSGNRSVWEATIGGSLSTGTGTLYDATDKAWEFLVIFRWPSAADSTNSITSVGMAAYNDTGNPGAGWGVRYMSGTDPAVMYYATGSAGLWGTPVSTGIAPGTGWHKLRIRSDGTTPNKVWLQFDNAAAASVCPSGCTFTIGASAGGNIAGHARFDLANTAAEQKTLNVDYLHFWIDYGAER